MPRLASVLAMRLNICKKSEWIGAKLYPMSGSFARGHWIKIVCGNPAGDHQIKMITKSCSRIKIIEWRKIWRHRNFICENLIFAPECLLHLVTPLHSVNFKLATWTVIVFEWSDYMNQCKSTTLGVSGPLLTLNDSSIRRLCQAPALDNSLPCYTGLTWKHFWKM